MLLHFLQVQALSTINGVIFTEFFCMKTCPHVPLEAKDLQRSRLDAYKQGVFRRISLRHHISEGNIVLFNPSHLFISQQLPCKFRFNTQNTTSVPNMMLETRLFSLIRQSQRKFTSFIITKEFQQHSKPVRRTFTVTVCHFEKETHTGFNLTAALHLFSYLNPHSLVAGICFFL